MKRLIAWIAIAVLSLAAHGEDFRLLTFNIRYDNPKDGPIAGRIGVSMW